MPSTKQRLLRFSSAILVLCLLATTSGVTGTVAQTSAGVLQDEQPEPDNTVTRIQLHPDGSATWEINIRTQLETTDQQDAYEQFQEDFRANKSQQKETFRTQIEGIVADAETTTGRNMSTTGFQASTSIQSLPQKWGVLTYRFQWENFAQTTDNTVRMGDVFGGGYFLSETDSMVVMTPEKYTVESISPSADKQDNTTVTWEGKRDFGDDEPRLEATAQQNQPTQTPTQDKESKTIWLIVGGLGLVIITIGFKVYTWNKERTGSDRDATPTKPVTEDTSSEAQTTRDSVQQETEDDVLLSDDERVLKALKDNDGRMKQAEIADTLDWSSSKTSRVLQRMTDEDKIRSLQIGRENLIDIDTESQYG